jgi:hypothetical protein
MYCTETKNASHSGSSCFLSSASTFLFIPSVLGLTSTTGLKIGILWRLQDTILVVTLAQVYHLATMVSGEWVDLFKIIEDH